MFSNDIVESLNRFLKQAFNEHSARGGGRQTAAGTASRGRSQASIDSDADALRQVLQWVFLYFHIHLHQHDAVRHVPGRHNVAGTGCWNVAGTRCLRRVGLSPASLSAGRDERDRGPGGSTGCTTPASPTGGTGAHALRATQQLCAGFASPFPTSGRSQTSSVGNPRSPARSRHGLPHKGPRQSRLSKRLAPSCPSPRLGAQ